MGARHGKPTVEKETSGETIGPLEHAVSAMQGYRPSMEDAHVCARVSSVTSDASFHQDDAFFAVLDGHAGSEVAKLAAKNLLKAVVAKTQGGSPDESLPDKLRRGLEGGMLVLDYQIRMHMTQYYFPLKRFDSNSSLDAVSLDGFETSALQFDDTLPEPPTPDAKPIPHPHERKGGSTCISAFVTQTHYVFGNLGDSRAILITNAGEVRFSTSDHKPQDEVEQARITEAGHMVVANRVDGMLAVSRAFGDYMYKSRKVEDGSKHAVSAFPVVDVIERSDDDCCLILACDGLWDVLTNTDMAGIVVDQLRGGKPLKDLCELLLDHCLHLNSFDNMSVVIVKLPTCLSPVEGHVPTELPVYTPPQPGDQPAGGLLPQHQETPPVSPQQPN